MGALKLLPFLLPMAALASGTSAAAQCRLCDKPTTTLTHSAGSSTIQLEIETNLDFDRLVLSGSGQGAALVRPDGSTAAAGAIGMVSPRAMVGTATVHGEPGRVVKVELPRRIDLYALSSGNRISVDDVTTDLPSLPRLDSAGNLSFHFGGRVTISGDADGEYRGNLPIIVEYP
jgi:hypothetical protein